MRHREEDTVRQPLSPSFWYLVFLFLFVASACSKELGPSPADKPTVGTVSQAATSSPATCPVQTSTAGATCTLYPDKDTTVYQAVSKNFGKGHEICIGLPSGG